MEKKKRRDSQLKRPLATVIQLKLTVIDYTPTASSTTLSSLVGMNGETGDVTSFVNPCD